MDCSDAPAQYAKLIKPTWSPPAWLFGPVWTLLYIVIAFSFGSVFLMAGRKEIASTVVLPFVLNIIFNFAFTPLQFCFRKYLLASIDIALVFVTLVWAIIAVFPHARWIGYMQVPYLFWVTFATALQFTITYLNKKNKS
jgi:tryptophan-rich sensory protein